MRNYDYWKERKELNKNKIILNVFYLLWENSKKDLHFIYFLYNWGAF